jgi:hypothetical protein
MKAVNLLFEGKNIEENQLVRDVHAMTQNKEASIHVILKKESLPPLNTP